MKTTLRLLLAVLAFAIAGCSLNEGGVRESPAQRAAQPRYVPEPGRDANFVASTRAAPAPAKPDSADGKNRVADRNRLAAQGYVPIGTGYFPAGETDAHENAVRQGTALAADKILLYPPSADPGSSAQGAPDELVAVYYVRFKLTFGATFRDLESAERSALGVDGGVEIGSVLGGTPAARANLLTGDYVVQIDGKPVANKAEFQTALRASAGRPVTLTVVRNGERLQRVIRLGGSPSTSR